MGIYTKVLNEQYLIESQLDSIGITKEDLKDKNKVQKALETDKKGKKRTALSTITTAFYIIGLIILAVPAILFLPIWGPIFLCVDKSIDSIKDKRKNGLIDKTCKEYQKTIDKLNKKLAKADEEEKKEIEKSINQFKSEIDKLQKKKIDESYARKIKSGIDIINKIKKNNDIPEDYAICSFWLYYNDISQKDFESKLSGSEEDIMENFSEDDNKELFDYFNKYKNDKWYILYMIDDTIFLYNKSKHQFFYGDWDPKWIKNLSFDDFKNYCKDFYKKMWKEIEAADEYLGYYKITEAPEGVEPVE